jgi:general secretion pathway protein G
VEVLIVIAIILILTSGVGFMAFRYIAKSRQVTARSQIETLSLALDAYALDCLRFPTTEQGLNALWTRPTVEPVPEGWDGPYVTKKVTVDPWGHPYEYREPGPNGLPFGIRAFGADGQEGGEGNDRDLSSWED